MTKSKKELNKFVLQLLTALAVGYWLLIVGKVGAQQAPEFLVTWRALNSVPADYQVKALPSNSTSIEMSFDLIDSSRIINLSRSEIRWSVNDRLLRTGIGLKSVQFTNDGSDQTVRITILDYDGNNLDKFVVVPSAKPQIVIDSRSTNKSLGLDEHVFQAIPLFFNIKSINELSFDWTLNNSSVSGAADNPNFLVLNIKSPATPQESEINVSVVVRNIFNELETATKRLNFLIE
jgi:hypothetical protein